MASALKISLCVFIASMTQAYPQTFSIDLPKMTMLKIWSRDANLNGEFEASRRAWLASIRHKPTLVKKETGFQKRAELSKEFIEKYSDILNQAGSMP